MRSGIRGRNIDAGKQRTAVARFSPTYDIAVLTRLEFVTMGFRNHQQHLARIARTVLFCFLWAVIKILIVGSISKNLLDFAFAFQAGKFGKKNE